MEDIVIVSAARTAVGKFGGTLAKTPATELGAAVIQSLLARTGLGADHQRGVRLRPQGGDAGGPSDCVGRQRHRDRGGTGEHESVTPCVAGL